MNDLHRLKAFSALHKYIDVFVEIIIQNVCNKMKKFKFNASHNENRLISWGSNLTNARLLFSDFVNDNLQAELLGNQLLGKKSNKTLIAVCY